MPIKAVIWDIGGVLVRTEDPTPRDELATALGVSTDTLNHLFFSGPEGTRAQLGQITIEKLLIHIRQELNLDQTKFPNLIDLFFSGDSLDKSLIRYIRQLKPSHKTGIISNAWSQLDDLLREWGIEDAFDVVIGSGDVGIMKPDPRIYQMALEGLDIQPQQAVFIDDFIENIRGAQALGIHTIHFRNRIQAIDELQHLLDMDLGVAKNSFGMNQ